MHIIQLHHSEIYVWKKKSIENTLNKATFLFSIEPFVTVLTNQLSSEMSENKNDNSINSGFNLISFLPE